MRYIAKTIFIGLALFLTSCSSSKNESDERVVTYTSDFVSHSYEEIKDKEILYSNIFGIDSNSYYVYFYSSTCSHCSNLKEFIVSTALDRDDIYFVKASDEINFLKSVEETIGLSSVEGFGILGYPSLIKIEEYIITKNIAGVLPIRSEFIN